MEHKKKVNAKMLLINALLLLEQLVLVTRVYSAKIKAGHTETGCTNCRLRNVKTIKKALSVCCAERLYDEEAQIELEVEYSYDVELVLQAFQPRFGCVVIQ